MIGPDKGLLLGLFAHFSRADLGLVSRDARDLSAAPIGHDLRTLEELERYRTGPIARRAIWLQRNTVTNGPQNVWNALAKIYDDHAPAGQAITGAQILERVRRQVLEETSELKARFPEPRPQMEDSQLHPLVDLSGKYDAQYSGHSAVSVAAAHVLSHLLPEHSQEIWDLADEARIAREVIDAHRPTHVQQGTEIGDRIGRAEVAHLRSLERTGLLAPVHTGASLDDALAAIQDDTDFRNRVTPTARALMGTAAS